MSQVFRWSLLFVLVLSACTGSVIFGQERQPLTAEQRQTFNQKLRALQKSLETLSSQSKTDIADAAIFPKGLEWALRYDRTFSPKEIALLQKALQRGYQRAELLTAGRTPWRNRKGKLTLGYVSRVDGSVQPYGLVIPKNYDSSRPSRLDVVLHGSSRPVGLSELRFMARFDDGDGPAKSVGDKPYIELHPLGRVENCYRWAGETDVFEAIADVSRRYNIDPKRIVLRGMSMGASGTWHLGLKHPIMVRVYLRQI